MSGCLLCLSVQVKVIMFQREGFFRPRSNVDTVQISMNCPRTTDESLTVRVMGLFNFFSDRVLGSKT